MVVIHDSVLCSFCFFFTNVSGRGLRECAMFSVRPENRHSLHYSTVKMYNDGQITCSWHSGRRICEHKVLFGEALNLSLTDTKKLHEKVRRMKHGQSNTFIVKPCSIRRIPVHPVHR